MKKIQKEPSTKSTDDYYDEWWKRLTFQNF